MSELRRALTVMGYSDEERNKVITAIGSLRRLLSQDRESMKEKNLDPVIIKELLSFREWYRSWKGTVG